MLIIEITPLSNGAHRNQSGNTPPPDGWITVPPELESEAESYLPFIDLTIEDGVVVAVAQGEIPPQPEPPEPPPDPDTERDELLVDHEYRLVLLELGV